MNIVIPANAAYVAYVIPANAAYVGFIIPAIVAYVIPAHAGIQRASGRGPLLDVQWFMLRVAGTYEDGHANDRTFPLRC